MSQGQIDWANAPSSTYEEEYKALLRSLKRTQGFGILFVRCSPAEGTQLIQQEVRKDLPDKEIDALCFDAPIPDGDLYGQVRNYLRDRPNTQILFIQGLEHSLYEYEDTKRSLSGWNQQEILTNAANWKGVPRIMANLNQQRENFRDRFPNVCFVFLVRRFTIDYLIHRAPDFFDWRSGLFLLPSDPNLVKQESERLCQEGDWQTYTNMTSAQRLERLAQIQTLLEENESALDKKIDLLCQKGRLLATTEEYIGAIASYKKALEIEPNSHKALHDRGITFSLMGQFEEAISSFNKALEVQPNTPQTWNNLGSALGNLGQHRDALACLDKALEIEPKNHKIWNNRGRALHELGRYKDALFCFDKALKINPNSHHALYNRGIVLRDLGKYEEAVSSFEKAIALQPEDYQAWSNQGFLLASLGRYEEAISCFDKSLEIQPKEYYSWSNRGSALAKLGRNKEALESYDKAFKINSKDPILWENKGEVLFNMGCYEEALVSLNKSLEIKPNSYDAYYKRGGVLRKLGRYEESVSSYEKAINIKQELFGEQEETNNGLTQQL